MFLLSTNPILVAAAVIPAAYLMIKVRRADTLEKEPTGFLILLVVLGIISTLFAQTCETLGMKLLPLFVNEDSAAYNVLLYFGVVAFSEEGGKYILLKSKTWKSRHFNCKFDGVVYGVFISLGFALWENISYVAQYGFGTAVVRALTAVPGHACFGVFMGIYYALAKSADSLGNEASSKRYRRLALFFPAFMHGLYDYLASLDSVLFGLCFIPFVAVMFIVARHLVKKAGANDSFIVTPLPGDDFVNKL